MFNDDICKLIALHLDLDDLVYFRLTCVNINNICKNNIFWLDKIYHDFGVNVVLDTTSNLYQSYMKLAVSHYRPIKGVEKYAFYYRDFYRLIFAAAKSGQSIDKLWGKFTQIYDCLSFIDEVTDFIEAAIAEVIEDRYIKAEVAMLFDDLDLLKNIYPLLLSDQQKNLINLAMRVGNGNTLQFLCENNESLSDMDSSDILCYTLDNNNITILEEHLRLNKPIGREIIDMIIWRCDVDTVIRILGNNLTIEQINSYAAIAAERPNVAVARYFINQGATNIDKLMEQCCRNLKECGEIVNLLIDRFIESAQYSPKFSLINIYVDLALVYPGYLF